tara:strand:- start:252 stop:494 length:243 start_codon:yes stop_codon:yes gene_type:complete
MEKDDWFVPRVIPRAHFNSEIVKKKSRDNNRGSHFKVMYCNSCRKVYENAFEDCKRVTKYYEDFPSIGLHRKDCNRCNEK